MSYALFKIVEKNGNSLECVAPTRWIKDSKVYWPKYATKQLALENAPMEPTWPAYDIAEIKKYHDDYNYLSKCCYSTTEDDSPIKKKPTEPKRTSSPQFVKLSSSYTNSFRSLCPVLVEHKIYLLQSKGEGMKILFAPVTHRELLKTVLYHCRQ